MDKKEAENSGEWKEYPATNRPKSSLACLAGAAKTQRLINKHIPITKDEGWSDISISLPSFVSHRIRERDLSVPALKAAANKPDGYISTADLISELETFFKPAGHDANTLSGRQDSYFSQIVRNLISHRKSTNSIFAKGYAEYFNDKKGIKITERGKVFLQLLVRS